MLLLLLLDLNQLYSVNIIVGRHQQQARGVLLVRHDMELGMSGLWIQWSGEGKQASCV